jgi:hypothetical protein
MKQRIFALVGATIISLSLGATPAKAAKFSNQFTEFELPPKWQCSLEGAEWVCQNTDESKKRDAIIVLAAKLKGDQDSLDQYLSYLKAAKSWTSIQGKSVKSEPKYAKTVNLNGQPWVDSLHMESEIPGFFTRYMATVKQDIGVLITYSINKNKYQQYLQDFENMIKTLKVFRKQGGINVNPQSGNIFDQTKIPQHLAESSVFPGANIQGGADNAPAAPKKKDNTNLIIIIAVLAVGFLIWKKRRSS